MFWVVHYGALVESQPPNTIGPFVRESAQTSLFIKSAVITTCLLMIRFCLKSSEPITFYFPYLATLIWRDHSLTGIIEPLQWVSLGSGIWVFCSSDRNYSLSMCTSLLSWTSTVQMIIALKMFDCSMIHVNLDFYDYA